MIRFAIVMGLAFGHLALCESTYGQSLWKSAVPEPLGRTAGLSEDRKTLLIASPTGFERWDAERGVFIAKTYFAVGRPLGLVVSDNRRYCVWMDFDSPEQAGRLLDLESGKKVVEWPAMSAAAFSPDSSQVAVLYVHDHSKLRLRVADTSTGKSRYECELPSKFVTSEAIRWHSVSEISVVILRTPHGPFLGKAGEPISDRLTTLRIEIGRGVVKSSEEIDTDEFHHVEYGVFADRGRRVCFCARQAFVIADIVENKLVAIVPNPHGHRCLVSGFPDDPRFLFFWPRDRKVAVFDETKGTDLDVLPDAAAANVWAVFAGPGAAIPLAGPGSKRVQISDDFVTIVVPRE